jgi:hypothetical protein
MWTIDIGVMGYGGWYETAGHYSTVDEAVEVMGKLPHRDCYGRWRIYRVRLGR